MKRCNEKKEKILTGEKEKLIRKNKWIWWKENEGQMEGRQWERKKWVRQKNKPNKNCKDKD